MAEQFGAVLGYGWTQPVQYIMRVRSMLGQHCLDELSRLSGIPSNRLLLTIVFYGKVGLSGSAGLYGSAITHQPPSGCTISHARAPCLLENDRVTISLVGRSGRPSSQTRRWRCPRTTSWWRTSRSHCDSSPKLLRCVVAHPVSPASVMNVLGAGLRSPPRTPLWCWRTTSLAVSWHVSWRV